MTENELRGKLEAVIEQEPNAATAFLALVNVMESVALGMADGNLDVLAEVYRLRILEIENPTGEHYH